MFGSLDAQQRHEQERQQRRAQAIEGRTDATIELAADLKEPAIYQARESQQNAGTWNRGPLSKQRCCIIEQSEIGELPIERPIFSVSIEAHRYPLVVVRSLRCDERSGVVRLLASGSAWPPDSGQFRRSAEDARHVPIAEQVFNR